METREKKVKNCGAITKRVEQIEKQYNKETCKHFGNKNDDQSIRIERKDMRCRRK